MDQSIWKMLQYYKLLISNFRLEISQVTVTEKGLPKNLSRVFSSRIFVDIAIFSQDVLPQGSKADSVVP